MARAKTPDDTIYVAASTGVVRIGDEEYRYVRGKTRVRAGHPLVRVHPEKFRPEALDTEKVVALRAVDAKPRRPELAATPPPVEIEPEPIAEEVAASDPED